MTHIQLVALLLAAAMAGAHAQQKPQELVPYRPGAPLPDAPPGCAFQDLKLPADFAVFAAGGYSGRRLAFQIDSSGHEATQMDVAVNYTAKPVVLMLGAYEPTVWNIGWTRGTRILAVLASGYHRQAIAGLEPGVPTLVSTYDNRGECDRFTAVENNPELNPLARRLFGRGVDLAYPMPRGSVVIGERVLNPAELVSSPAVTVESFRDRAAPLAGEAGLEAAVRKGILRRATQADAQAWQDARDAAKAKQPRADVPPVAGGGAAPRRSASLPHNGYVVLKDFEMPAGLYGAHSATFFVPKGVPRPRGNPGHSSIYDFNNVDCAGPGCGSGG